MATPDTDLVLVAYAGSDNAKTAISYAARFLHPPGWSWSACGRR